uniref:Uncharacterized protein n=1 Tax=Rhizophora mucronata TaxID=61149 RepID=A0A2P2KTP2_RHIMU
MATSPRLRHTTKSKKNEPNFCIGSPLHYTSPILDCETPLSALFLGLPLLPTIVQGSFTNTSSLWGRFAYTIQKIKHNRTPTEIRPSPEFTIVR